MIDNLDDRERALCGVIATLMRRLNTETVEVLQSEVGREHVTIYVLDGNEGVRIELAAQPEELN